MMQQALTATTHMFICVSICVQTAIVQTDDATSTYCNSTHFQGFFLEWAMEISLFEQLMWNQELVQGLFLEWVIAIPLFEQLMWNQELMNRYAEEASNQLVHPSCVESHVPYMDFNSHLLGFVINKVGADIQIPYKAWAN